MTVVPLLAQCMPGRACELPRTLPWYFGVVIALLWGGCVVGVVVLARRRLHLRRQRRRSGRRRATAAGGATPVAWVPPPEPEAEEDLSDLGDIVDAEVVEPAELPPPGAGSR